jgi:hypothetical protein
MRAGKFSLAVGAVALVISALTCADSTAGRAGEDVQSRPPGIDWDHGIWTSDGNEYGLTDSLAGYPGEDQFEDPNYHEPPNPPPFKPAALAAFKKIRQAAIDGRSRGQGDCSPEGLPTVLGTGTMDVLFKPGMIFIVRILPGDNPVVRHIYLDRHTHPTGVDLEHTYLGDSIGHWEGKTLVVDTVGLVESVEDVLPTDRSMHIIERWTQSGPNMLHVKVTFIDPEVLTKPWGGTWYWKRDPNGHSYDSDCIASQSRDLEVNGGEVMLGPDGKPLLGPPKKK